MRATSTLEPAPSLRKMFRMWVSTVLMLRKSSAPGRADEPISDPFVRTLHVRELLGLRALQMA